MIIKGKDIQREFQKHWNESESTLMCKLIAIKAVLHLHGQSLKKVDNDTRASVYKACSRKGVKANGNR